MESASVERPVWPSERPEQHRDDTVGGNSLTMQHRSGWTLETGRTRARHHVPTVRSDGIRFRQGLPCLRFLLQTYIILGASVPIRIVRQ